jgi:uncharacterized membrane protein
VTEQRKRLRATGRTRAVLICAIAAIISDAVVAAVAYGEWRAYAAAPKDFSSVAGDDVGYFLVSLIYAAVSAVRYLVLLVFVIALLCWAADKRRGDGLPSGSHGFRFRLAIVVLVSLLEALYFAVDLSSHPNGVWCMVRISTCVVSAVAAATAFMTVPLARSDDAA